MAKATGSINQQLVEKATDHAVALLEKAFDSLSTKPQLFPHGITKIDVNFELGNAVTRVVIGVNIEGPQSAKPG